MSKPDESSDPPESGGEGPFPKTSRTLYQRVVIEGSRDALEEFFRRYWVPMYGFLRARGASHEDASDLVQEFILQELLGRDQLKAWKPDRGRLRTFLKVALDRFRLKDFQKQSAQKRGGIRAETHLSLDFQWAEGRYQSAAVDRDSPDRLFEREWAEVVVQQVLATLGGMYQAKGKAEEFRLLCRHLGARAGDGEALPYREIAATLNTTENNVKQKMTTFRDRFRRALRSVVAQTVEASEVEEEVAYVTKLLTGR